MNLRFPGAIADATGLDHLRFRDLNSTLGQWMEADPIGLAGSFPGYPYATVNGYPYAGNNPITNIDPWGLDVLVITGGWNGGYNVFGHSAIAVTGGGVYSYGTTNTPLGMSVSDFLNSQSATRNLTLTLIKTTPAQDAAVLQYLNEYPDQKGVGKLDNCASRTLGALDAGGVNLPASAVGPAIPLPIDVGFFSTLVSGATTINVPRGGTIPANFINQFNPTAHGGQCPAANPCSTGSQ